MRQKLLWNNAEVTLTDRSVSYVPSVGTIRKIITPIVLYDEKYSKSVSLDAIWDTGASRVYIRPKIAAALGLKKIGEGNVVSAIRSEQKTEKYAGYLKFNYGPPIHTEFEAFDIIGADCLIGMSFFNKGTAVISHDSKGRQKFKFTIINADGKV